MKNYTFGGLYPTNIEMPDGTVVAAEPGVTYALPFDTLPAPWSEADKKAKVVQPEEFDFLTAITPDNPSGDPAKNALPLRVDNPDVQPELLDTVQPADAVGESGSVSPTAPTNVPASATPAAGDATPKAGDSSSSVKP